MVNQMNYRLFNHLYIKNKTLASQRGTKSFSNSEFMLSKCVYFVYDEDEVTPFFLRKRISLYGRQNNLHLKSVIS